MVVVCSDGGKAYDSGNSDGCQTGRRLTPPSTRARARFKRAAIVERAAGIPAEDREPPVRLRVSHFPQRLVAALRREDKVARPRR